LVNLSPMTGRLPGSSERTTHWQHVYEGTETDAVSWYQAEPELSLSLMDALGMAPGAGTIDVGGGASVLVDRLLARGFSDLTVLDISKSALHASRQRVGADAPVTWLAEDLLTWEPRRTFELWHDRAVFHFLSRREVEEYQKVLCRAVAPGGVVIMATFAADGPERCSGLPVTRYEPHELGAALGPGFEVVEHRRELHATPRGTLQPFTWVAARRTPI